MGIEDAAANLEPVRVGVDEAGRDGFAADVEDFRACWDAAARADALEAVVLDDDVGVFQDFIALHGDDGGAAKDYGALEDLARKFEVDGKFFYGFFLFFEFFRLLFGLFVLLGFVFLLRVGRAGIFFVGVFLGFVLLLAFLLFFLGRLEGDGRKRLAEEARTNGPGDGLAAVGPSKVVGANVGDFLQRDGSGVHHDRGRFAAHLGHGRDVELVHDVRQHPVSVGAGEHIVGGVGLIGKAQRRRLHLQVRAAVGAVVAQ